MQEKYERLVDEHQRIPISDDFMFSYVMHQPGICAKMIDCLLPGIRVAKVAFRDEPEEMADTQKTISGNLGSRSVRLDVYLDDGKTVFNVEMQTGNKSNLPKRVRYYGDRIDCDQLAKSQDYNELRPTYVIFICLFDPFGDGLSKYTFENECQETGKKLGDESYKLFFNVKGNKENIAPEQKALLDYFDHPENFPQSEETELIRKLDRFVDFANQDNDWRRSYMTYMQAQADARNEGIAKGIIIALSGLVRDGILTVKEASARAGMPEQEFRKMMSSLES